MSCDANDFRSGMRRLAAGVTVITTCLEGQLTGMTATAVCSLSASPPRLLACVNLRGATYRFASASRRMAVNVLALHQEQVARDFSSADKCLDKLFADADWRDADGLPVLGNAAAVFECLVEQMLVMDTHAVLIGSVARVHVPDAAAPLLYVDGAYAAPVAPSFISTNDRVIRRTA
ncbi:flavin reductase family protein [Pigmentiphaga kullae]|uniref:Flavin reductase (NADH)/flavin reductase n=1 Tax=Pigmentiphaga kullae TaxID=151784 RepID=A0A4V2F442_9BURK|nr:flavin reductase family protein [Pigmentiphaga kullae]RZS86297.1 flavin reductase (NADH)/flavin reductase [Pigmentiphaga kullae]